MPQRALCLRLSKSKSLRKRDEYMARPWNHVGTYTAPDANVYKTLGPHEAWAFAHAYGFNVDTRPLSAAMVRWLQRNRVPCPPAPLLALMTARAVMYARRSEESPCLATEECSRQLETMVNVLETTREPATPPIRSLRYVHVMICPVPAPAPTMDS